MEEYTSDYVANWTNTFINQETVDDLTFIIDLIMNPREVFAYEVMAETRVTNTTERLPAAVSVRFAIDRLLKYHGWHSKLSNGNGYTFWVRNSRYGFPNDDALITMISYPSDNASPFLGFIGSYVTKMIPHGAQPITKEISMWDLVYITEEKIKTLQDEVNFKNGDAAIAQLV